MTRPNAIPPIPATNLAQQKNDFTSEGAPMPGKVGHTAPAEPDKAVRAKLHVPTHTSSARKNSQSGRGR